MSEKPKTYTFVRSAPVHDHPHDHDHNHTQDHSHHAHDHTALNERKTRWVVILTTITMVLEIWVGHSANSMALLAEGWHMSTHVFAMGLAWITYYVTRRYQGHARISFRKEKLLALTGFTSAIILQVVAVTMVLESVDRLIHPLPIRFGEAIIIAMIGLAVNILSAALLHHDHAHGDHSIRAAYMHVLADGLTGATAIIALLIGMHYNLYSLDAVSGLIGAVVITSWAVSLIKSAGAELIEFKKK